MRRSASRTTLPIAALMAAGVLQGCTAGLATARLLSADKAVEEARRAGADAQAPFEYTLARRYLEKAVEQSSRSEYRSSIDLAKLASARATEAVEAMQGTRRIDLENAGDDINEDEMQREATEDGTPKPARGTPPKDEEEEDDLFPEDEEEAP